MLNDNLNRIKKDTAEIIAHRTSNLSLIGTFSSGKTTLINTFLGERDIQLKTSQGHNTAVLMKLFYEDSQNEYYDILYKNKLVWTLVKPGTAKKPAINKSGYKLKIISIDSSKGVHIVVGKAIGKENKTYRATIRSDLPLIVKVGDEVEDGAPFAKVNYNTNNTVEICSKSEIELLQKIHKNFSGTITIKNSLNTQTLTNNEVDSLLSALYIAAGEKSNTIQYETLCKNFASNHLTSLINQNENLETVFQNIVFESKLEIKNERKILDKQGWMVLCGVQNSQIKTEAYSEKPECYMLARELELHINSEFLQYCSLTDTPGFGSVTEEHDNITERYIRDNSGRLLVMIAINAKTMDAKFQDLINNINDIYDNFRKEDKKNVVFVLNCFEHIALEEQVKKHVNDVIKLLATCGFNKNNIFVCNLKKSLKEKQNTEKMFGYPSYMAFHDFIINEMISTDLTLKYKSVNDKWNIFFDDSMNTMDNKITTLTDAIDNLERKRKELNDNLVAVRNIDISSGYNYGDINDFFSNMSYQLKNAYTSGSFFKGMIRDNIRGIISSIKNNSNSDLDYTIQEDIKNIFETKINRIYNHAQIEPPELSNYRDWSNTSGAIVVYEISSIESLLYEAVENTPRSFLGFGKSAQVEKQNYYKSRIDNKINNYRNDSKNRAENYLKYCCAETNSYKQSAIIDLEETISNLESKEKLEQALQECYEIKKLLIEMKKKFNELRWIKFN